MGEVVSADEVLEMVKRIGQTRVTGEVFDERRKNPARPRPGKPKHKQRGQSGKSLNPKLAAIVADMKKFPRKPDQYPRMRVTALEANASPGTNTLTFRAIVAGETANYKTTIQFRDVEFQHEQDDHFKNLAMAGGEIFHYHNPSLRGSPVVLKCECEDFRYRWEHELYDSRALIGRPRAYTRKTPPPEQGGAPYANPEHHLGFCKHVRTVFLALRDSKRIDA